MIDLSKKVVFNVNKEGNNFYEVRLVSSFKEDIYYFKSPNEYEIFLYFIKKFNLYNLKNNNEYLSITEIENKKIFLYNYIEKIYNSNIRQNLFLFGHGRYSKINPDIVQLETQKRTRCICC